jgi:hypothetical protein
LEQVSSRGWSRKSCHDYPVTEFHRLLLVEPRANANGRNQCEGAVQEIHLRGAVARSL